MKEFKIGIIFLLVLFLSYYLIISYNSTNYDSIKEVNYEINDPEIKIIVDKFYRDLNNFNVFPVISKEFKVKLTYLDSRQLSSHIHGVSLGGFDDDVVEIYINKNSWDKFNKTQKYYLIYHELSHDVLNLDDLKENKSNIGKIMYPTLSSYDNLTMNDFIINMKNLFSSLD